MEPSELEKKLAEENIDINIQDRLGNTALHWVDFNKQRELVRILMENSANIHIKNHDGLTPLDLAKKVGKKEILDLMQPSRVVQPKIRERKINTPASSNSIKRSSSLNNAKEEVKNKFTNRNLPRMTYLQVLMADKEKGNNIKFRHRVKSTNASCGRQT